jgi:hypothetical protein
MKTKGILLIGIFLMALFTSCEELETMFDEFGITVNSDVYEIDIVIPPAPAGTAVNFKQIMQNDIDQTLENQGYGDATVKSIKVINASIEVMEDSQVTNLNSVESVITKISTETLPETTLMTCINNTPDAILLPMEPENLEVSNYMQEPEYNLIVYGTLREATTDTLHITGKIQYQIDLNVKSN